MNDKEFSELHLQATIVPQQAGWPEPEFLHWKKLHAAADEARQGASGAWSLMEEIEKDADLSREGKERKKNKVAADAIANFQKSRTLSIAKEAVERQVAKWAEKTGMAVRQPANIAEAVVQSEIRAHLAAMKGGRLDFLQKHVMDPVVASAVLGAPAFLSGLNDQEIAVVKQRIEKRVAPEIAKARDATLKAMKETEAGWQRAIDKIAERATLAKGPEGTWSDQKMLEPAAA